VSATARIWAVIPAAGTGSRFSASNAGFSGMKQYACIGNATVLEHSVSALLRNADIEKIVIALHPEDTRARQLPLLQNEKICFVQGGAERSDSVRNALLFLCGLSQDQDWILVHDAARPCLLESDLQNLVDTLQDDPVGGILAVPVTDTLKKVDEGNIVSTIDRSSIWQAQTPQMFRFGLLLESIQQAQQKQRKITDEAAAIEASGYTARVVSGSRSNIKITYPDDLALAAFYLREGHLQQESVI
jgi:2-C-methyl-D-erythritol 4-phosphate cytidylyltransferase